MRHHSTIDKPRPSNLAKIQTQFEFLSYCTNANNGFLMSIRTHLLRYKSKLANFSTSTLPTELLTNNSYNHSTIL
jgi:hypothetical protein